MTSALQLKSATPFVRKPYGSLYESIQVTQKFCSLNKESDGPTHLAGIRALIPWHLLERGENWTILYFHGRPAIYHAIFHQNIAHIESLLTSPEGRVWANQPYIRPHLTDSAIEFPIHTAADIACGIKFYQWYKRPKAQAIVLKLIELKADPTQEDKRGRTPLHKALITHTFFLVKFLIQIDAAAINPKARLSKWYFKVLSKVKTTVSKANQQVILKNTPLPKVLAELIVHYLF
jgi:hypothetical protein